MHTSTDLNDKTAMRVEIIDLTEKLPSDDIVLLLGIALGLDWKRAKKGKSTKNQSAKEGEM